MPIADRTVSLPTTGMTCANCAANVERTLNKKEEGVVAAIEKAGYGAIAVGRRTMVTVRQNLFLAFIYKQKNGLTDWICWVC